MTTASKVLEVLAQVAETDEVQKDLELRLFDRRVLDSLRTVELIIAFSDAFGVEISPAELDIEMWATPQRIIAYMEQKVGP